MRNLNIGVFTLLITLLLFSPLVASEVSQKPPEVDLVELLPEDDEIEGWVKEGEPNRAYDLGSLSRLINGEAPFYLDRGMKTALFQEFNMSDEVWISVEIYLVEEPEGAEKIYKDRNISSPTMLEGMGEDVRLAENLIGAYLLEFSKSSYFVKLTTTNKSKVARDGVVSFAQSIYNKIR